MCSNSIRSYRVPRVFPHPYSNARRCPNTRLECGTRSTRRWRRWMKRCVAWCLGKSEIFYVHIRDDCRKRKPYTFKTSIQIIYGYLHIHIQRIHPKVLPRTKLNRRSSTQLMWCLRFYVVDNRVVLRILLILYLFWQTSRAQNFRRKIPYNLCLWTSCLPFHRRTKDILFAKICIHFVFGAQWKFHRNEFRFDVSGCGTSNRWTLTMAVWCKRKVGRSYSSMYFMLIN